jgi:prepilin-type N-terminal cleavage/methylation domain-containing protein
MPRATAIEGFTLVEMLIAMTVLTCGLLAVGQLLFASLSSASLARSKSSAAIAAQNQLDSLADLYRQRPVAAELSLGYHGPLQAQVVNPITRVVLNRYNVSWVVSPLPDPRPGKMLSSRLVRVTATPATAEANTNSRVSLNKIVSISGILSPRMD